MRAGGRCPGFPVIARAPQPSQVSPVAGCRRAGAQFLRQWRDRADSHRLPRRRPGRTPNSPATLASSTAALPLPPPAVSTPGVVERIVRSPGRFCVARPTITTLGLALDRLRRSRPPVPARRLHLGLPGDRLRLPDAHGAGADERRRGRATTAEVGSILWDLRVPAREPPALRAAWPRRLPHRAAAQLDALVAAPAPGLRGASDRGGLDGRSSAWSLSAARTWPARWAPRSRWCPWAARPGAGGLRRGLSPSPPRDLRHGDRDVDLASRSSGSACPTGTPSGAASGYVFFDIAALHSPRCCSPGWSPRAAA